MVEGAPPMNALKENQPDLPAQEAVTEVDDLLEGPKNKGLIMDDVLSFNKDTKRSEIEDFSNEVEHGLQTVGGEMASYFAQGEDDLNLTGLDGILDEIKDLDCANGLSCSCEEYFLDIDLAQEVSALNGGPSNGFYFSILSPDSHSPGYSGSSNGAIGMSETSTVTTTLDVQCNGQSYKIVSTPACFHDLGKKWKLENSVDCLVDKHQEGNKRSSLMVGGADENILEKRKRKPPQRYIEESSKANSSHKQKHNVVKNMPPMCRHPKKGSAKPLVSVSEDNSSASESDYDWIEKKSMRNDDRRKRQRMWTLQEVTKLVDGICEFGVGHWTDIKRLSFTTSAYRTPIDLRDKWRNLLRASYAQGLEKGEAEQKQKGAGRSLPESLLHRIRELAAVHPYPRKSKTRASCFPRSS
ncbi:hypothetical protein SAY86_019198 [Trapa natans]|uniref:Uncharacterized protein n=1 Tax=Trapa natans TaxID=22666 RepID=A0AAN7LGA6_TRANT|nr:hypothetical protein SAY86_019198 [Trapa natans]